MQQVNSKSPPKSKATATYHDTPSHPDTEHD
jgi:hypothetical protein